MGLNDFMNAMLAGEGFALAAAEAIRVAGLAAVVLVLLVGLLFFLPTIVATLRHIKARVAVCVLNVLAIVTLFFGVLVPVIIWLVIMIMAIVGNPEIKIKQPLN